MDDLISRQDALDAFGLSEKTRKYGGDRSGYETMMLYEIQDVIENLSPVIPQQKMGHWIFFDKAHEHAHCSECDYGNVDLLDGRPHNYCPNCGCRMEVKENG